MKNLHYPPLTRVFNYPLQMRFAEVFIRKIYWLEVARIEQRFSSLRRLPTDFEETRGEYLPYEEHILLS